MEQNSTFYNRMEVSSMKKMGLVAGFSFLAGALFFALFFGFIQGPSDSPFLTQPVAVAESTASLSGSMNFAPLVKKVRPAVVKVQSLSIRERGGDVFDRFFNIRPRRERVPGVGSGFFISPDGYIITNNHVVKDAIKVNITTLDDKEYKAKVVGTDARTDLALLKVNVKNMPFISLGNSSKVEVGEWVLAIGNPLNQDLTVTAGIISAKGRQLGMAQYEDFLQTDAAINQGNSGGPLVNMEGRVIGINSAILAPSGGNIGIGFAIPSDMAKNVIDDLKSKGRVIRGWLGVSIEDVKKEEARELDIPVGGVLVVTVERDSPAERAGIKKWDVIIAINNKKIKDALELSMKIAESKPGETVSITLYRRDEKKTVKVTMGELPETVRFTSSEGDGNTFDLGMVLVKNSLALRRENSLDTSRGLLVTQVQPESAAAGNGIRKGDIILEANGRELDNVEDFRNMIQAKKPGSTILLYVNRGGAEGMLRFRLPE